MTCSECHKEQTRLNKLLTKTIQDAQEYSTKQNKEVIVYPTDAGFGFAPRDTYTGNVYITKVSPAPTGN